MRLPLLLLLTVATAFPQTSYYRHTVSVDGAAVLPRGELRSLFADSFGLGFDYGFRFHPYFQVDTGLKTVFGAARINDYLDSAFGRLRIRDYQFFVPFGGRVIVPLANDRIQFYAGGGGAYLRYTERLRQPGDNFRIDCDVCASRHGLGSYGIAGADVALDRYRHFRLGGGARVIRGNTEGDPLGNVPARRTTDRWIDAFARFSFSF